MPPRCVSCAVSLGHCPCRSSSRVSCWASPPVSQDGPLAAARSARSSPRCRPVKQQRAPMVRAHVPVTSVPLFLFLSCRVSSLYSCSLGSLLFLTCSPWPGGPSCGKFHMHVTLDSSCRCTCFCSSSCKSQANLLRWLLGFLGVPLMQCFLGRTVCDRSAFSMLQTVLLASFRLKAPQ